MKLIYDQIIVKLVEINYGLFVVHYDFKYVIINFINVYTLRNRFIKIYGKKIYQPMIH